MILIWGWRALRYVLGTGEFFCPQCGTDSPYQHLRQRRWFTLFFIPVIPLEHLGSFVECQRCRSAFTEAVLGAPTLGLLEYHQGLANRAAVAHLASLARPMGPAVEDVAASALASAPGVRPDYDRNALHADIRVFTGTEASAAYLRPLAGAMTVEGREAFLRRAAHVAATLPGKGPDMDRALESYALALDISQAHLLGIRQSVLESTPAPGNDL